MDNSSNNPMNVVKVNLNNGEQQDQKNNSNINYQELNMYNSYKDNDNSG